MTFNAPIARVQNVKTIVIKYIGQSNFGGLLSRHIVCLVKSSERAFQNSLSQEIMDLREENMELRHRASIFFRIRCLSIIRTVNKCGAPKFWYYPRIQIFLNIPTSIENPDADLNLNPVLIIIAWNLFYVRFSDLNLELDFWS